jgi:hypothetical protein
MKPYAMASALRGLSEDQRKMIRLHLTAIGVIPGQHHGRRGAEESPYEGWSIYRQPTTGKEPRELLLHKRDARGKLIQVIVITQNGVTRIPKEFA